MLVRILRKLRKSKHGLQAWYWRKRMRLVIKIEGGTLDLSPSVKIAAPVRCDGRGTVKIGEDVLVGCRKAPRFGKGEVLLQARGTESVIEVGKGSILSNNSSIIANQSIKFGDRCLVGDGVAVVDSDFHAIRAADRDGTNRGEVQPVEIGHNVWLGSRSMVLKGVTIGDNTVVAAGAVVASSLPANVIAAGVPAKVIKHIAKDE